MIKVVTWQEMEKPPKYEITVWLAGTTIDQVFTDSDTTRSLVYQLLTNHYADSEATVIWCDNEECKR